MEIKCGQEIIPYLKEIIENSGKQKQIVIIGFGLETVAAAKKAMPSIPVYWLIGTNKDEKTGQFFPHDPNLIQEAKKAGIDGLDVHYAGVENNFADKVRQAGQKLYTWTVDNVTEAKRLADLGVSGITTNKPDVISKALSSE